MSLNEVAKSYLEANPDTSKPVFLKMMGGIYTGAMGKKKIVTKKDDKVPKEKTEKKLNAYQVFMQEQMTILQERENQKGEGEKKKKPRELMTEISEMWKLKKGN